MSPKKAHSLRIPNGMAILWVVPSLARHVVEAAYGGQSLPLLTVIWVLQTLWHLMWLPTLPGTAAQLLWLMHLAALVVGYSVLYRMYCHTIPVVFNKTVPLQWQERVPSLAVHLKMMRPLAMVWRWWTWRFRVLPDVVVVGEVRCGTTTLCHHLSQIEGCHTPFCPWKHPELDHKESFYFVGHYFGGWVFPPHYRLCFPLKLTMWWYNFTRRRRRRPAFFTFDGCAQYLTSPTTPHLLAQAYRLAGEPPPVIVACVRHPLRQAQSWWRFERAAMTWASQDMGLRRWCERSPLSYPPTSFSQALLEYAPSPSVTETFRLAEELVVSSCDGGKPMIQRLPPWALTWPGGQLAGIGRNGQYATHIRRYERVFDKVFGPPRNDDNDNDEKKDCQNGNQSHAEQTMLPQNVLVVPLEWQTKEASLCDVLTRIMTRVQQRQLQKTTRTLTRTTMEPRRSRGEFWYNETIRQTARRAPWTRRNSQPLQHDDNDDDNDICLTPLEKEEAWNQLWKQEMRELQEMICPVESFPKEELTWLYL